MFLNIYIYIYICPIIAGYDRAGYIFIYIHIFRTSSHLYSINYVLRLIFIPGHNVLTFNFDHNLYVFIIMPKSF